MILKLRHFTKRIKQTIDVNAKQLHHQSRGIAGHLVLVFMLGMGVSLSAYSMEIIDLGPDVNPEDINNNGTVVGAKTVKSKPFLPLAAFRWTSSGGLETLNGVSANAINDNEQIAGNTKTGTFSNTQTGAFSYNGTTFNTIGSENTAQGINQLGQIAGSQVKVNPFGRTNGTNPAIYDLDTQSWSVADVTTFRSRGRRKGVYAGLMRLTDINDSGIAVGNKSFSGLIYSIKPFILLPGAQTAEFLSWSVIPYGGTARAINNLNHFVGTTGHRFLGSKSARTVYNHAYFYDYNNADFVDLGTLSGAVDSVSSANDINESDQVVGSSTLFEVVNTRLVPRTSHAFIWENGTMTDLNDLIPTNTGWVLVSATAINDNGDIVGLGIKNGVTRGYVLDAGSIGQPDPAPVNQAPVANVNADVTSGDVTLTVNFTGSDSYDPDGSVVDYRWDFGDGSVSNAVNPSHSYTSPGQFTTTLTVTDDGGKTNSASTIITVTDSYVGCISNCITVSKITLKYKAKSSKIKGRIWLSDENNNSIKSANVHAVWTLPDGSTVDQYQKTGKRSRVSFKLRASDAGNYMLTIDQVTKSGYSFDPNNSNVLEGAIDITR
jgi:probable HAF family extracellular repeat protein